VFNHQAHRERQVLINYGPNQLLSRHLQHPLLRIL